MTAYENTFRVTHIPTGEMIDFNGIVENFQDEISPSWNTEEVYGRMDPIVTYQNTSRRIKLDLEFDIVGAASISEKLKLFKDFNKFYRFIYPTYEKAEYATTLKEAPLLRIRWFNMLQSAGEKGLLVAPTSFNITNSATKTKIQESPLIYASDKIRVNLEAIVLHESPPGWQEVDATGKFTFKDESMVFPYLTGKLLK